MSDIRLLVVDDHPLFRAAVLHPLRESIVEAASVAALGEALAANPQLDLVLLDLAMPGVHGLSSLVYLRGERPEVPMVVTCLV